MKNILIVGLGSIAKKHILAINTVFPEAKIHALRTNKSTNENDISEYTSFDEIVTPLDLVIISNPTYKHHQTIENCLVFDCPILIEKPVLISTQNSDSLIEKINETQTYVACNLRFHPCIEFLKKYFSSNTPQVNEINIYCGSYLPAWRENTNFRENYSANAAMGGGVHLDLIHELDYCTWIWGFPKSSNSFKTSHSSLAINAVDYAHYVLEYPNFIATITLNYFRLTTKREIEIVFDQDIWTIDLLKAKITNNRNEIVFEDPFYNVSQTYIKQMEYIKHALEKKQPFMNDIKEALNVLKICNDER
ncbi:MAG: Gfo/Idh/MocA family oxidoreductase [Pseudarcicella sp.]|nr:Gfo/Idh/MocA family oxidoreductase [Pseudarcicella sp.]MBP6410169.1 Gfo/Idh/MocA family oxidoreductase [Pseudarcicella sp.]